MAERDPRHAWRPRGSRDLVGRTPAPAPTPPSPLDRVDRDFRPSMSEPGGLGPGRRSVTGVSLTRELFGWRKASRGAAPIEQADAPCRNPLDPIVRPRPRRAGATGPASGPAPRARRRRTRNPAGAGRRLRASPLRTGPTVSARVAPPTPRASFGVAGSCVAAPDAGATPRITPRLARRRAGGTRADSGPAGRGVGLGVEERRRRASRPRAPRSVPPFRWALPPPEPCYNK